MKASLALGLMIALLSIVAAPQVTEAGSATEINAAANATLQSFVDQNSNEPMPDWGLASGGVKVGR